MKPFTPGPWHAKQLAQFGLVNVTGADEKTPVAFTGVDQRLRPASENEANACLIALAPRMFEACKAASTQLIMRGANKTESGLPDPLVKELQDIEEAMR